jgi:1-acyl-sn-glycerol-3-phosphate acyltransferase
MEAAIRAEVPVQPLSISYQNSNGALAKSVEFVGATTFVGSMLRVLADDDLAVLTTLTLPQITHEKTRHDLAVEAKVAIELALGFE